MNEEEQQRHLEMLLTYIRLMEASSCSGRLEMDKAVAEAYGDVGNRLQAFLEAKAVIPKV